jgi:hypothetical protein
MTIVLGFVIALGIFPWLVLLVHMYVYHWRKDAIDWEKVTITISHDRMLEDFSRYGCLPGWDEPPDDSAEGYARGGISHKEVHRTLGYIDGVAYCPLCDTTIRKGEAL